MAITNYRIKDIAKLSGVSTGTVDRILHNRGRVSEEARLKVNKVLKEIDYHPNLIARSLALKKNYNFIVLHPSYVDGSYWSEVHRGIENAKQELYSYNVRVEEWTYDQYDQSSFEVLIPKLMNEECQGVVIAVQFKQLVIELTRLLDKKGIPYVFIDATIEGANQIAYYGTDLHMSGYVAGRLMFEQIKPEEDFALFRFLRKGDAPLSQVRNREEGFFSYMQEHEHKGRIQQVNMHAEDKEHNWQLLDKLFKEHPNLAGGIIFNSRVHLLAEYRETHKDLVHKNFQLIGYDCIPINAAYLHKGLISYLIAQRPEVQGGHCVRSLFRYLVLQEQVKAMNYMPIDILVKENIDFYNNYI